MANNTMPVSKIPEVRAYASIKEELDAFKAANPEFFEELHSLVDRHNAALDLADKAVRAKQVSCGDFKLLGKPATHYNAEKLCEELGQEAFESVGGAINRVVEYAVDKSILEAHIARGAIAEDVLKHVKTIKCRYDKPEKIVLP